MGKGEIERINRSPRMQTGKWKKRKGEGREENEIGDLEKKRRRIRRGK